MNLGLNLARLIILILTIFLAWITYQSNLLLKRIRPDFNLLLSPPELIIRVVLVGFCLFLAWLMGLPAGQLGLVGANPWPQIGLGLAAGATMQVVINLLAVGAVSYFGREIYSPWVVLNILPRRPVEWVLVPLALLPAVAMEELLFRPLWLGGFGDIIPLWLLMIGTSLLFGAMHLPQGYLGIGVAAGLNGLLSLLFLGTGSVLAPLAAHYTINLLQVIAAHFQRDKLEMDYGRVESAGNVDKMPGQ
ncbi:MAG: CPBP family intramembrane metalloprotease [Anaerolineae bacterium]|nr:CPBP family intramembrane metalloprotease [Anaerolineae bacterium]